MGQPLLKYWLADEDATCRLGAGLAASCPPGPGLLLTLRGELGAGKSTLARALLRALGVGGTLRSPTYTLTEPYATPAGAVLHMDLYRLAGADELESLGYRDWREQHRLLIVEWPEKAAGALGPIDLDVSLSYGPSGRRADLKASTQAGEAWLATLPELYAP